jgi:hypothetical protein
VKTETNTSIKELEKRVEQFRTLSLPGQPMSLHMGTSYLVSDLWAKVKELSDTRAEKWKDLLTRWTNDGMSHPEIDELTRETVEFLTKGSQND